MRQVSLFILLAGLCLGVIKATGCTTSGRFPNDDIENCRGYTICLLGGANGFTQYKLTCPAGFVYTHFEQKCTNATNYQCLPSFVCNITGTFENPLSKNCSSYVACPESLNGIVSARQVECPLDQVFNSLEAACVNSTEYKCSAGVEPIDAIDAFSELPPVTTFPQNTTNLTYVQVSGENGHSDSVNSAVYVCSKHAVLFAIIIFVNFNKLF